MKHLALQARGILNHHAELTEVFQSFPGDWRCSCQQDGLQQYLQKACDEDPALVQPEGFSGFGQYQLVLMPCQRHAEN